MLGVVFLCGVGIAISLRLYQKNKDKQKLVSNITPVPELESSVAPPASTVKDPVD